MLTIAPNTMPAFMAGEAVPVEVRMKPQPQDGWVVHNLYDDARGLVIVFGPADPETLGYSEHVDPFWPTGTRHGVGDHHCEVITAEPPAMRDGVWFWRATVKRCERSEA